MQLLVVEDEPTLQLVLKIEMESQGYEVTTASCGEEAKRLLEDRVFDLILTDVLMANGNGIELVRWVNRTLHRKPEIVVITGTEKKNFQDIDLGPVAAVIQKPFLPQELLQVVSRILNGRPI